MKFHGNSRTGEAIQGNLYNLLFAATILYFLLAVIVAARQQHSTYEAAASMNINKSRDTSNFKNFLHSCSRDRSGSRKRNSVRIPVGSCCWSSLENGQKGSTGRCGDPGHFVVRGMCSFRLQHFTNPAANIRVGFNPLFMEKNSLEINSRIIHGIF